MFQNFEKFPHFGMAVLTREGEGFKKGMAIGCVVLQRWEWTLSFTIIHFLRLMIFKIPARFKESASNAWGSPNMKVVGVPIENFHDKP